MYGRSDDEFHFPTFSDTFTTAAPASNKKDVNLILGVSFGVIGAITIFLIVFIICKKRRKRVGNHTNSCASTITTTTSPVYVIPPISEVTLRTTDDVTKRYQRSVSSLCDANQVYLVPFSVLPPDFDFASREVEVKSDYVILKDLNFLNKYSTREKPAETYEKQDSFNPYFVHDATNLAMPGEKCQKQLPFNPDFY